ncbi:light-harvesting complex-like protein OHP2, chloroplastic isoform X2 [Magnolia sinica]|uniref:light-harvesting complex-like protein OHP2, chloroplastic isoform X2 n=1 Tax=Magnolia sinica TaxID=86752 RepID=UPI002658F678|nr:light-harvesting complex-like protein OHP2, chloroplastic isoform X2 [Magnolia sinica]
MSVAYSIPSIKISSSSSSSSPSSSSSSFKFRAKTLIIRSSKAEGPLRRPVAPPLREPSPPLKPIPLSPSPSPSPPSMTPPPKPAAISEVSSPAVVTMEFQRKMAKELQDYFKQKKLEEADQGPFFGFIGKNEISNGSLFCGGFRQRCVFLDVCCWCADGQCLVSLSGC